MNYLEKFSENVARIRKSKGLTQAELSKKMRVSSSHISALEKGQKNPSLKSIVKIADALNVRVGALLQFDDLNDAGYVHLQGLIENNFSKWESKQWYHQRFDGAPYFMHLIGEAETCTDRDWKESYAFDVHYCFIEKGKADWYILQDDIDRVTSEMLSHLESDEEYCKSLMRKWKKAEEELAQAFVECQSVEWSRLSDDQLLERNDFLLEKALRRFSSSSVIDGFALGSDKILESRLKEIYEKKKGTEKGFYEFFSAITAPTHLSFINQAEIDLLLCADAIRKNPDQKEELIEKYRDRYFWIRNNYVDAHDLQCEYFETSIMRLVVDESDLESKVEELVEGPKRAKKIKSQLIKEFGVDVLTQRIIDATDHFTQWQDERKRDTMLCTHYFTKILSETSSRTGVSLEFLKYLTPRELRRAFEEKDIAKELKEASEQCVVYWSQSKFERISQREKVDDLKKRVIGESSKLSIEDFRGMTASSGKAIGTARVLRSVGDINKVKEGDILVAIMTRPDYVPAMKKAGAIVTNEGGITCHAAIVSRELGRPCIIGTKIATQVVKDGDLVEVNANHGVVKILERAENKKMEM